MGIFNSEKKITNLKEEKKNLLKEKAKLKSEINSLQLKKNELHKEIEQLEKKQKLVQKEYEEVNSIISKKNELNEELNLVKKQINYINVFRDDLLKKACSFPAGTFYVGRDIRPGRYMLTGELYMRIYNAGTLKEDIGRGLGRDQRCVSTSRKTSSWEPCAIIELYNGDIIYASGAFELHSYNK